MLPEGLRLNGLPLSDAALPEQIRRLTESAEDIIILRAGAEAPLQRVVTVGSALRSAGFSRMVLIE